LICCLKGQCIAGNPALIKPLVSDRIHGAEPHPAELVP
jgi:hypothetical protein